ncbi:c-type cytochrome [Hydrogenophaga sp.]|uniref:c-type cytochrome n=1 Tax=Hydrogenophaga sp. TaxID=1904254 RepID=UPI003F6CEB76
MKHHAVSLLLLTMGLSSAWAQNDKDTLDLLKSSGCMTCHAKDEKVVGPSFQSIAAKYAGQSDAGDTLAQSVRNGSRGKWGRIPMPAHASLSAEDLKTMAHWVMTQKP